jgi:hypothetical protein
VMPPRVKYCINQKAWAEAKKMFSAFFEKWFQNNNHEEYQDIRPRLPQMQNNL